MIPYVLFKHVLFSPFPSYISYLNKSHVGVHAVVLAGSYSNFSEHPSV